MSNSSALFDPLIMQSLFVEEGLRTRAPIVARTNGELWYMFINLGIPLLIIIFLLFALRLRANMKKRVARIPHTP